MDNQHVRLAFGMIIDEILNKLENVRSAIDYSTPITADDIRTVQLYFNSWNNFLDQLTTQLNHKDNNQ